MGKGKGLVKYWVAPMFSGTLLTEVGANHYSPTIDSLFLAHVAKKIPLKTCVTRMKQPTIRLLYSPRFSVVSAVHTVPTAI
jgi:ribosomal protein L16/L10AE